MDSNIAPKRQNPAWCTQWVLGDLFISQSNTIHFGRPWCEGTYLDRCAMTMVTLFSRGCLSWVPRRSIIRVMQPILTYSSLVELGLSPSVWVTTFGGIPMGHKTFLSLWVCLGYRHEPGTHIIKCLVPYLHVRKAVKQILLPSLSRQKYPEMSNCLSCHINIAKLLPHTSTRMNSPNNLIIGNFESSPICH